MSAHEKSQQLDAAAKDLAEWASFIREMLKEVAWFAFLMLLLYPYLAQTPTLP